MTLVVEEDKSFDPPNVGFLRHLAIVARANCLADLIKELGFRRRCRCNDRCAAFETISVQLVYLGAFHVVSSCRRRRSGFREKTLASGLDLSRSYNFLRSLVRSPRGKRPYTGNKFSSQPRGECPRFADVNLNGRRSYFRSSCAMRWTRPSH